MTYKDTKTPSNFLHNFRYTAVENGNIIPPTWQKNIDKTIEEDWQIAFEKLRAANHIRIIGYSLPVTDAYIHYLLKASVLNNNALKSINVICLDKWGAIQPGYDKFIKLPPAKYQFSNSDVVSHLAAMGDRVMKGLLMDDTPKLFTNDWVNPFN